MKHLNESDTTEPVTEEASPPPKQLQHDTDAHAGGACRRCGLVYSWKTAYTPCFIEGDTKEIWRARHPELRALVGGGYADKTEAQP